MPKSLKVVDQSKRKHAHIIGWGVDKDPANRPGIPREQNQENVLSPNHHLPIKSKQTPRQPVELTLERNEITPILGDVVPTPPLSGSLRKFAFRYSEDALRHWMILLLADRVNMVEGWFEDISRGKMPMILPRMEFRTTDHLRRIVQQGPKSRADKAMVISLGALVVGLGAFAYLAAKKSRAA